MVHRCTDPSDKQYGDYGGRGITVCTEWLDDPWNFFQDMGVRPLGHTLERKDNSGPYSANNCVWASRVDQANNKRNVPLITHAGESKSVAQWARGHGMPAETLRSRLKAGMPFADALRRPKCRTR